MVAPVLLRHVLDDLVAALHREVHVDVGHRLAARVEEALEEQVVLERVDVGDAQRVGHDAARRRAAPRPHRDARVFGELDEVPDDQEVGAEAHVADGVELEVEALGHLGARLGAVAALDALRAEVAQVLVFAAAVGHRVARQQGAPELELDVAALGDLEGGVAGVGVVGEQRAHLVWRL